MRRQQQDLQLKVRERYRRLLTSDMDAYDAQMRLIVQLFRSEPAIRNILEAASRTEPELDRRSLIDTLGRHQGHEWRHTTEDGQATLVWALMQAMADGEVSSRALWAMHTGSSNINDNLRAGTEKLFAPLFDYLAERLGEHSTVLHMLERYVLLLEWFDRDELLESFESRTGSGEQLYNAHLRRFLFTEGMDVPFTEAQSPSGQSDALANLHTDDPFVCEVKVFDGKSRGRRHVATGVQQAYSYATDYGQDSAYLVVVNLSGQPLRVVGDSEDQDWPPHIDLAGVRVYVVVARGRRIASASKAGAAAPYTFGPDDLLDPDPDQGGELDGARPTV